MEKYDVIIVGAGTAGLTAAIYALRAGKTVAVFEKNTYGGQIVNTPDIENYPGLKHVSGFEFATALYEQATELGAKVLFEEVTRIEDNGDIKAVTTSGGSYEATSVILATGAKNRPLGIDREEELIGKGISYCATCDGMFFRNKVVAVNGGGNTALEDATFLANFCSKVYVIHRRDEFRGDVSEVNKLKEKDNVEFVLNCTVTELIGDEKLSGVKVLDKITGEEKTLEVEGLFIAIGQMPENSLFANVVNLEDKGYIIADESCTTKTAGVYVAGDCRTKTLRQLTTAASDGAIAASLC